jgi:hypothetical protein
MTYEQWWHIASYPPLFEMQQSEWYLDTGQWSLPTVDLESPRVSLLRP